jgi:hypothetical protein
MQRRISDRPAGGVMTTPLSVLQTLWTRGMIRCVFVQHLRPPVYAVQVFDGANVIYTELVDDREEALNVAASGPYSSTGPRDFSLPRFDPLLHTRPP